MCSAPHAPKRTSLAKQTSRPKGTSRSAQAEHIVQPTQKARRSVPFVLAGMAGFEPTNAGVKVPCLTAWRHPNRICGDTCIFYHNFFGLSSIPAKISGVRWRFQNAGVATDNPSLPPGGHPQCGCGSVRSTTEGAREPPKMATTSPFRILPHPTKSGAPSRRGPPISASVGEAISLPRYR